MDTRKTIKKMLSENCECDAPSKEETNSKLMSEGLSEGIPFEEEITIKLSGDIRIESFSESATKQPSAAKVFWVDFNKKEIAALITASMMKALQGGLGEDIADEGCACGIYMPIQTEFTNRIFEEKSKED